MDIFYCSHCKKWTDFDDFQYCIGCDMNNENDCDNRKPVENFGCCGVCGNAQITKEVVEGYECSECHKLFPKDEGTEYNHRKTGIDEVDCDVRCEDCEGAREIRESDEKSFRQSCWTRR